MAAPGDSATGDPVASPLGRVLAGLDGEAVTLVQVAQGEAAGGCRVPGDGRNAAVIQAADPDLRHHQVGAAIQGQGRLGVDGAKQDGPGQALAGSGHPVGPGDAGQAGMAHGQQVDGGLMVGGNDALGQVAKGDLLLAQAKQHLHQQAHGVGAPGLDGAVVVLVAAAQLQVGNQGQAGVAAAGQDELAWLGVNAGEDGVGAAQAAGGADQANFRQVGGVLQVQGEDIARAGDYGIFRGGGRVNRVGITGDDGQLQAGIRVVGGHYAGDAPGIVLGAGVIVVSAEAHPGRGWGVVITGIGIGAGIHPCQPQSQALGGVAAAGIRVVKGIEGNGLLEGLALEDSQAGNGIAGGNCVIAAHRHKALGNPVAAGGAEVVEGAEREAVSRAWLDPYQGPFP